MAFGHFLCSLSRDLKPQILPQTVISLSPKRDIFIKHELVSSPKGQEFDQKLAKKKKERKEKSNATTMPVTPTFSVQTLIPTLMVTNSAFNL